MEAIGVQATWLFGKLGRFILSHIFMASRFWKSLEASVFISLCISSFLKRSDLMDTKYSSTELLEIIKTLQVNDNNIKRIFAIYLTSSYI
jgi:hypothetical protein